MVKKTLFTFSVLVSFAFASCLAFAQDAISSPARTPEQPIVHSEPAQFPAGIVTPRGTVITPPISDSHRRGVHTNYKIFVPEGQKGISAVIPLNTFAENPASLACIYKVGKVYAGCFAGTFPGVKGGGSGGWGAIAVVDAYDHPTVANDLQTFDTTFGLPAAKFTKVIANSSFGTLGGGFAPTLNASCSGTPVDAGLTGWDVEIDLDTQYAHAMAPAAKIILVEACTQNLEDLLYAEAVAGIEVAAAGGGTISNSWGYPESCAIDPNCNGGWNQPLGADDNFFYRFHYDHISYYASSGDSPGDIIYPSTSPWVVSVGGTQIDRDANGNFVDESCWSDSGGGFSAIETWANPPNSIFNGLGAWADYQYELFGGYPYASPFRSTPDIAAEASLSSGVWVFDTDPDDSLGWLQVGGTSVASPVVAGIVNASNARLGQTPSGGGYYRTGENNLLYSELYAHNAYPANFYDVTLGNNSHPAGPGYDQCTGIGTPRGKGGK